MLGGTSAPFSIAPEQREVRRNQCPGCQPSSRLIASQVFCATRRGSDHRRATGATGRIPAVRTRLGAVRVTAATDTTVPTAVPDFPSAAFENPVGEGSTPPSTASLISRPSDWATLYGNRGRCSGTARSSAENARRRPRAASHPLPASLLGPGRAVFEDAARPLFDAFDGLARRTHQPDGKPVQTASTTVPRVVGHESSSTASVPRAGAASIDRTGPKSGVYVGGQHGRENAFSSTRHSTCRSFRLHLAMTL